MRITVTGRHMDLSAALKAYATEKSGKLERYYDRAQSCDVVFEQEAGHHTCEIITRADHHTTFVAKETRDEPYAALDATVKDLERQLTRHKEKFRNRKHTAGRGDREPMSGTLPEIDSGGPQAEGEAS